MSTEEQDAVFGRLIREQRDHRRHLALIDSQLDSFRGKLRRLQSALEATVKQKESASGHPDAFSALIEVDFEELRSLLNQRAEVVRDLGEINIRLAEAGNA